jgi:quercetin dioxygenase-like cupin family protein
VPEVVATHIAVAGPAVRKEPNLKDHATILLFIQGKANLRFAGEDHAIDEETIALPISPEEIAIDVPRDEVLHYVRIHKKFSEQDLLDIKNLTARDATKIYFTTFEDCEPYREAIKSPKTISRTVLPNQYIPRVAMGTVQTTGPDEVGAHRHPMLDQLFLWLAENNVIVSADETHARFKEYSLLHIPLGSLHGVKAEPETKMYYMWMDFFLTKEGEEWLKTHKPFTE